MTEYLKDFKEYLFTVKKSSSNTIESYVKDVRSFLSYSQVNFTSFSSVNSDDIKTYIDTLEKSGKNHSTLVRNLASVRSFYEFLIYKNEAEINPTKSVKLSKAKVKLPEISQPNVSTLRGCRDKAMLELLYATGLEFLS